MLLASQGVVVGNIFFRFPLSFRRNGVLALLLWGTLFDSATTGHRIGGYGVGCLLLLLDAYRICEPDVDHSEDYGNHFRKKCIGSLLEAQTVRLARQQVTTAVQRCKAGQEQSCSGAANRMKVSTLISQCRPTLAHGQSFGTSGQIVPRPLRT